MISLNLMGFKVASMGSFSRIGSAGTFSHLCVPEHVRLVNSPLIVGTCFMPSTYCHSGALFATTMKQNLALYGRSSYYTSNVPCVPPAGHRRATFSGVRPRRPAAALQTRTHIMAPRRLRITNRNHHQSPKSPRALIPVSGKMGPCCILCPKAHYTVQRSEA